LQIILDDSLLEDCLKGNRLSQQQLYKNCFDFLIRICRRYVSNNDDALDLMNQTFLKVLTNLSHFRKNEKFEVNSRSFLEPSNSKCQLPVVGSSKNPYAQNF
jgi:hypothetical protein